MTEPTQKPYRRQRRSTRLINLQGRAPDGDLTQFFLEERSRRSFGVTGYLVSGGGGGAVSCWFAINSLYALSVPVLVLHLLLLASGVLLIAMVVGFFAALAGYEAFDEAVLLPAEEFNQPNNRADRWLGITTAARMPPPSSASAAPWCLRPTLTSSGGDGPDRRRQAGQADRISIVGLA